MQATINQETRQELINALVDSAMRQHPPVVLEQDDPAFYGRVSAIHSKMVTKAAAMLAALAKMSTEAAIKHCATIVTAMRAYAKENPESVTAAYLARMVSHTRTTHTHRLR
jgi:hypothetical protein